MLIQNIKISICIPVFNQETYIKSTIESVIDQNLKWPFEILVGDDASDDGTQAVLESLQKKYPSVLKVKLRKLNIGPGENAADLYRTAAGQYIAHLDGDDLMLPGKLNKQIEILDSNSKVIICSHDVIRRDKNTDTLIKAFSSDQILNIVDLYQRLPFFANSSKVFRNEGLWGQFEFINNDMADFEFHLIQAERGFIYHISEFLGIYNANIGISFKGNKVNKLLILSTRNVFNKALLCPPKGLSKNKLQKIYAKKMYIFSLHSARLNQKNDARIYAKESMNIKLVSVFQPILFAITFVHPAFNIISKSLRFLYEIRSRSS
jgi:glycosyltransferase involved in cell wall biosynthesis